MKIIQNLILTTILVTVAALLTSCQPEKVEPKQKAANNSSLSLDADDPHPIPDPVCSPFDTIYFMSEDHSPTVNYCGNLNCPPSMPEWGFIEYFNSDDIMVANITMATGWFMDISRSKLGTGINWLSDQNGVPQIQTDWLSTDLDVVVNKWQLRIPLNTLPSPCFEVSLNITAVKLNFFAGVDPNSATQLWGYNPNWNTIGHQQASVSPFVSTWCPAICPGILPEPDSTCVTVFPGLPNAAAGCADLTPSIDDAVGAVTYEWTTGATTASINVCPTGDTDYTATVTDSEGPLRVVTYNVNAEDILCTPGNRPSPKVLVCHVPPGNPANAHTICIDWSGVPAHVEEYRTAAHNPRKGHDSGCRLGPCNSNPCANQ